MEKVRVVICVEDGNVSAVHAASFVDVEIYDIDNLKAKGKTNDEIEAGWLIVKGDTPSQW